MFQTFVFIFFLVFFLIWTACNYRYEKQRDSNPFQEISAENLTFALIKKQIFSPRCFSCHSAGGEASHVSLDTREELVDSALEIVIPGNPDESGIIIATTRADDKRMPPPDSGIPPLTAVEIDAIRQWILKGAPE